MWHPYILTVDIAPSWWMINFNVSNVIGKSSQCFNLAMLCNAYTLTALLTYLQSAGFLSDGNATWQLEEHLLLLAHTVAQMILARQRKLIELKIVDWVNHSG